MVVGEIGAVVVMVRVVVPAVVPEMLTGVGRKAQGGQLHGSGRTVGDRGDELHVAGKAAGGGYCDG